jgi:Trk-type K+ transport system membrane component
MPSLRFLARPELVRHGPDWFIDAFHSVSAYYNTEFAMFPDNLASFRKAYIVDIMSHPFAGPF